MERRLIINISNGLAGSLGFINLFQNIYFTVLLWVIIKGERNAHLGLTQGIKSSKDNLQEEESAEMYSSTGRSYKLLNKWAQSLWYKDGVQKVCLSKNNFQKHHSYKRLGASLVAQLVKSLPAMQETWVWSLGWEDPLEKRKGYLLQDSGLENSMDCIVHGVAKSWLNWMTFTTAKICKARLVITTYGKLRCEKIEPNSLANLFLALQKDSIHGT